MAERRVANWTQAPGPMDQLRRTSPYLVPWAEVPEKIQDYYRDFVRLMPRLLDPPETSPAGLHGVGGMDLLVMVANVAPCTIQNDILFCQPCISKEHAKRR